MGISSERNFFGMFLMLCLPLLWAQSPPAITSTHGLAIGDVSSKRACVWSRANREALMHVKLVPQTKSKKIWEKATPLYMEHDFTGKVFFDKLEPATSYTCYIAFSEMKPDAKPNYSNALQGTFHTPASDQTAQPVAFAWGGDLAGQNVCRDAKEGFPILKAINKLSLDFFVGLGDMIYADNPCLEQGMFGNKQVFGYDTPGVNLSGIWKRWKYTRADPEFKSLLSRVPYFAIWDDHEVVNDFGPHHDTRSSEPYTEDVNLMPIGLTAFLDYNPVFEDEHDPARLYRSIRWNKHVEIFFLDTRQYRDPNSLKDDPENPKSMLSKNQLEWFKKSLKKSKATWKIIVSSVPISIPTGYPPSNGRDGWANFDQETGFEGELRGIFRFLKDEKISQTLWITTDVHFASAFEYTPFADSPEFKIYEVITGPLQAGLYPSHNFDKTFGTKRLFFYGPDPKRIFTENEKEKLTYQEARQYMNFGLTAVDQKGNLSTKICDVDGKVLYELKLAPPGGKK